MINFKKIIAVVLVSVLFLTACASQNSNIGQKAETTEAVIATSEFPNNEVDYPESPTFSGMDDPVFLQYIEDNVRADLAVKLASDDYEIEQVNASYYSKEYIDDLTHNTQANIFFGYTLDELDIHFKGEKYEFALSEDGKTVVRQFKKYDDTTEKIIKNVAIGAGVIIVLVVVTIVTEGSDIPAVAAVCAISGSAAKGAAIGAASGALISGAMAGIVTGIETQDLDDALVAAALQGSEGFKWGAITGAISGGFEGAINYANAIRIPSESEKAALSLYGGKEQVSFLGGKEVPYGTPGATRPDLVRNVDGVLEAIEVKNYDLANTNNLNELCHELKRQITTRATDLPTGSVQRIVLDVKGRGFSESTISNAISKIREALGDAFANIPIDIMTV